LNGLRERRLGTQAEPSEAIAIGSSRINTFMTLSRRYDASGFIWP
jgi:hypothetical protein